MALAGLFAAGWFIFTARSVLVEIDPPPDDLRFEGGVVRLEIGGRYLLRPGSYTLVAEKAGYRRLETAVMVTRIARQTMSFSLEKLPGYLELVTRPDQGAVVMVDGKNAGVTPLEPLELGPGEHELIIRAERYREIVQTVSIEGGGVTQQLTAELEPLWAAIAIDSRPPGAIARIDGEMVGTTPLTSELEEGAHLVVLSLQGHKPFSRRIEVVAGEPQTLSQAVLQLADGRLLLRTEPSGASVMVDGQFRGPTPLDLYLAPARPHELSLSKVGHMPHTESVELVSGETKEISLKLEALLGDLEIQTEPSDAELYIDGEAVGAANQTVRLAAVPHQIEIKKKGYQVHRQTVTLRPGVVQSIRVTLATTEQARVANTPQVIKGPQGQELRLIEPGRFRMGASRREPGRRANETLREVELTRAFYLATREVSNREFRQFISSHMSGQVGPNNLEIDHHPVVRVTWDGAAHYCNWLSDQESLPAAYVVRDGRVVGTRPLSTGYRLPTEAEWAWAARFAGGRQGLKYPWGSSLPVAPGSGNYADGSARGLLGSVLHGYQDGFPATAPVDSFAPNGVGILNLGGNVAEWVHDFYTIYPSSSKELYRDPLGPEDGEYHVIRGSSWMDSSITELRLSYRDYLDGSRPDVGFRIARYAN